MSQNPYSSLLLFENEFFSIVKVRHELIQHPEFKQKKKSVSDLPLMATFWIGLPDFSRYNTTK
jgi:hypothetical protein